LSAVLAASALLIGALTIPREPEPQDEAGPVAQHERLMKLAGRYTTATKFTGGDGAAPMESAGEATFTSILGGRFLLQEEKGTMFGHPFETRKMYGFNAESKKYEGVWTYTGSTAMMTLNGTSGDDGKTITFGSSYEGPGGKTTGFDIVMTEVAPDKLAIVLKSKAPESGKPSSMETTYTRKK
jgi:hypothetical protein